MTWQRFQNLHFGLLLLQTNTLEKICIPLDKSCTTNQMKKKKGSITDYFGIERKMMLISPPLEASQPG